VVEHVVGALLAHQLLAALAAGGADDTEADGAGELPTPPLAPWTSSVSPATMRALWKRPRYAVAYGMLTAAPCAKEIAAGSGFTWLTVHAAISAYAPVDVSPAVPAM
jgi:hypothetical protein